jgi:hypothetical protein
LTTSAGGTPARGFIQIHPPDHQLALARGIDRSFKLEPQGFLIPTDSEQFGCNSVFVLPGRVTAEELIHGAASTINCKYGLPEVIADHDLPPTQLAAQRVRSVFDMW